MLPFRRVTVSCSGPRVAPPIGLRLLVLSREVPLVVVALDSALSSLQAGLQTELGPTHVVQVGTEQRCEVLVTGETDPTIIRMLRRTIPFVLVIDRFDAEGRHDHEKFVGAVNAGAAAYLFEPSLRLVAAHVRFHQPGDIGFGAAS